MRAKLENSLYLTRREFLKDLAVGAVAGATGCVDINRYFRRETPKPVPTLSPIQRKQKEWIDRYNKAYGANLTLNDLPLHAEKAAHQLKMYENVDFVEPVIEGPEDFKFAMRMSLDLLKEKDYLDYVYVSKNAEFIKTWDENYSRARENPNTILVAKGYNGRSKEYNAGTLVHEVIHLEIPKLLDEKIIIPNPYQDPLGGMRSEILAYKAEAECLKTLGVLKTDEDVKKYIEDRLRTHPF